MNLLAKAKAVPDAIRVLRISGDPSTPEGRAHERHRRALFATLLSLVAKSVSIGTMLITVPLTLGYLGTERYGMWMILSSMVAMLSFADLGIGNGVLNAVSAAHGRDDPAAMQRSISSATVVLCLIAAAILIAFAIAYPHIAWHRVFNVRSELARGEAGPAIAVFVLCFAVAIPFSIVQRVQMGLQLGFLANLWQCAASIVGLIAVVIAVRAGAGLATLVAAFMGAPLIAAAGNSLIFFGGRHRHLAPQLAGFDPGTARDVMQIGVLFLILQIAAAAIFNSHSIIIAQIMGAGAIASFAVPERLFGLISMLFTMLVAPLWPAYREAITRGDPEWVQKTFHRSIKLSIIYGFTCSIILFIAAPFILRLWVGNAVAPSNALLLGIALWKAAECVGQALSMFLNGAHVVKPQVAASLATAVVSIGLGVWWVTWFGIVGAAWGTLVALTFCALLPYSLMMPRILRRIQGDCGEKGAWA